MNILNKNPKKKTKSVYSFKAGGSTAAFMDTEPTTISTVTSTHVFKK